MTLGWGPDAGVANMLFGSPSRPTVVHIYTFTLTQRYMHTVLSLNNMAAVLETLTKVSVEASKQYNERAEKNQSTRQLTPVQNPEIYSTTLTGYWAEHATCVKDEVTSLDHL